MPYEIKDDKQWVIKEYNGRCTTCLTKTNPDDYYSNWNVSRARSLVLGRLWCLPLGCMACPPTLARRNRTLPLLFVKPDEKRHIIVSNGRRPALYEA